MRAITSQTYGRGGQLGAESRVSSGSPGAESIHRAQRDVQVRHISSRSDITDTIFGGTEHLDFWHQDQAYFYPWVTFATRGIRIGNGTAEPDLIEMKWNGLGTSAGGAISYLGLYTTSNTVGADIGTVYANIGGIDTTVPGMFPIVDDTHFLGHEDLRWKEIYVSDAIYINGVAVALSTDIPAANTVAVVTGSYTGDGATSQAITGLGITPKVVHIVRRIATVTSPDRQLSEDGDWMWTTAEILDDDASGGSILWTGGLWEFDDDHIIALGSGSFTVDDNGADEHPNKSGIVYNYWCIGS